MEATLAVLLGLKRRHQQGEIDADEVYVWWGKVKSSNRQQPMAHLAEILAMGEELLSDDEASEMHLYLTDYRSLYVGHVASITTDDLIADKGESENVPAYYASSKLKCDCWFQLLDIRRLILDDTIGVVEELKKLRNTKYNDRPVSIYGGMVDLPLVVTRVDGARYFDDEVRAALTDKRLWVEFDAERTGVGEMERELRENVVGEAAWDVLDPAVRLFVATAETLFRAHRRDPAFDFSPVVVDFAKAIEVQTSIVMRRALSGVAEKDRRRNLDGRSVDLAVADLLPIGVLARLIGQDEELNRILKRRLRRNGEWFTASLPPLLTELADVRNPAAHTAVVSRERANGIRDRLLGIGTLSILSQLAQVQVA
jgi:hypothetical protein